MLTFFPRYFSIRAIICYVVTLILVSAIFMSHAMPFQFMVFGLVSVVVFFSFATKLTMGWQTYSPHTYARKLFITAFLIRLAYTFFIYFYYIEMTGEPFAYHAGDEIQYHYSAAIWRLEGFKRFWEELTYYYAYSDRGYIIWLGLVYKLLGTHVLPVRVLKCFIDAFTCVLMYNLAKRNFGEAVGRMTAVFCMLMPNMWYYCGISLKETEMVFLVVLFLERADAAFHLEKLSFKELILPLVVILVMFTFRTPLAGVLIGGMAMALVFTSKRQLKTWQKVLYGIIFSVWMVSMVSAELWEEAQILWQGREQNQSIGYEWRASRENGNSFARYASASVFAPFIFTIPFSSMVAIMNQEHLMMLNGACFIKNILSGFTILALFMLLFRGDWRKHVLIISVMCGYLVVLVFSNFAHSERFHFPVLPLELMFAAYGISQVTLKHKRWYTIWLVGICIANIAWSWIKLAGRGLVS